MKITISSIVRPVALVAVAALMTPCGTAMAQDKKVELSGFVGYTIASGVEIDSVVLNGVGFDKIGLGNGLSYGFAFDVAMGRNWMLGAMVSQQDSSLDLVGGSDRREIVDMKVNNYHARFTYMFGDSSAKVRPFVFGGLGATSFNPGEIMGSDSDSETKFSTTWGGGLKMYASDSIGLVLTGRWTPTYIKSDPAGIWCNPYYLWGCYVISDADFAHQFEVTGGVAVRF